jgi:hypothetical protein
MTGLGSPVPPATDGQGPPPSVGRHPRYPEMPGHLPLTGPRLNQPGRGQPHLLPAGPLLCQQPATIGIPDNSGIAHDAPAVSRACNLRS